MPTWEFPGPGGIMLRGTGETQQDAKVDAIVQYNRQATAASAPAGKGAKPKEPDIVGRIKQGLVGSMSLAERGASMQGDVRDPSSTVAALKGAGEVVLPGSIEELAIQAATGAAGQVGRAAGKAVGGGIPGQVVRTATGVALPAATGALLSEDPKTGAIVGAISGTLGEAARVAFQGSGAAIEKVTRKWGNLETKAYNARVRESVGPMLARDVAADIPSLREAGITLRGVPDVIKLLDDSTGRQVVGKMFDQVEGEVAKKVGSVSIPRDIAEAAGRHDLVQQSDELAMRSYNDQARMVAKQLQVPANDSRVAQILEQAGIKPSATMTVEASGQDAIAMAKQLRHQGLRRGEGIQGRPPRAMAEDLQQRLDKALLAQGQSLPGGVKYEPLVKEYAQLRDDYSKFMDLRDWLIKSDPSKLFPGQVTPGGATIDLVRFGNGMIRDISDLPPSRFPNLHRTMTGGGGGTRAIEGQGSGMSPHIGVGIPGTHIRAYPSGSKGSVPELPANTGGAVGSMPSGAISKAGKVGAGVGRAGATALVPSISSESR